jgi:alkylation response protein AidB-like acyl-CoA dehydrogenase
MNFLNGHLNKIADFAARQLRPRASEFESKEEIPFEIIQKLAQLDVLGATIPNKYGGLSLDSISYGKLTEIIGKACNSVRELITVQVSLVSESINRWGTEEQKMKWLPQLVTGKKLSAFALTEPDVGSDAKSVRTTYTKVGNRFILKVKKNGFLLLTSLMYFL